MKKIDKILKFLNNEGLSVSEFERQSGLSNSYLNKTHERGADLTKKIEDRIRQKNSSVYYKIFPEEISQFGNERNLKDSTVEEPETKYLQTENYKEEYIQSLKDQIKKLESHCAFVEKMYEEKLNDISSNFQKALANQETMLRQIAAESMLAARRYAGKDDKKYQEELERLGILITAGR